MVRIAGIVGLMLVFAGFLFADDLMQLKDQGGTAKFTVDPNGNVGIGATIPGNLVEIRKDAASVANGLLLNNQQGTGWGSAITFASNYTGAYDAARIMGGGRTSQGNGALYFETANSTGGLQTRMTIDNNGQVGIGMDPSCKLSVRGGEGDVFLFDRGDAAVKFTMGYTGATTDMYLGTNTSHKLRFKTAGLDRMAIDAIGNVGIGTTSPDVKLSVAGGLKITGGAETTTSYGTSNVGLVGSGYGSPVAGKLLFGTDNSGWQFRIAKRAGTSETDIMTFYDSGQVGIGMTSPSFQLQLSTDSAGKPSGGSWTNSSDERLKKDIRAFEDGLATVKGIRPIYFKFNGLAGLPADDKENIGVIAQEIVKVAPYTVGTYKAKLNDTDAEPTELMSFNASALTFVLVNAVKELDKKNKDIKKENEDLQKKVDDLESRLKAIEEKLAK